MQNWIISRTKAKYHLTTWGWSSLVVPFGEKYSKNTERPRQMERHKKSHYSLPLCHSDDSLSAALLSSLVAFASTSGIVAVVVVMKNFFMQIFTAGFTWKIALIINGLATALMLVYHLEKMLRIFFCFEWQEKAAIAVKGKLHDRWQSHGPPDVHSNKHWKSSLVARPRKSLPIKWEQFEKAEDTLRKIYNLIKCIWCH